MHTMHYWRPHVTKRTGTSVFLVRALRIFSHFPNFPRNRLFSGKIWRGTRGCHRRARMSNHYGSNPKFLVKIVSRASKNRAITNSDWTNVRTFVHICSAFVPNILWCSLIYRLTSEWRTYMTKRIHWRLLHRLHWWMHMFTCVWPNTFVKCIRGFSRCLDV